MFYGVGLFLMRFVGKPALVALAIFCSILGWSSDAWAISAACLNFNSTINYLDGGHEGSDQRFESGFAAGDTITVTKTWQSLDKYFTNLTFLEFFALPVFVLGFLFRILHTAVRPQFVPGEAALDWRGGPASYGLRRMLVDETGRPKLLLEYGQRKNLKTEHVVLVPGPKAEIKIIQKIFTSFANEEKTRTEIANDLNARGIRNAVGKPWSMLTVSNILKNEVYLGNIIFNRRSQKLGEKQVINPRDMWIRHDSAFKPIVSPTLFARAQEVRDELRRGRARSDKDILNDLSALLKKEGRLSLKIMLSAKGVPNPSIYARRFGSVMKAYKLIGYKPEGRYSFLDIAASVDTTIHGVTGQIIAAMEKRRANVSFLPELYLLTINHGLTIGMAVARAVRNGTGTGPSRRWEIRKVRFRRSDFTLVMRLNSSNTDTLDYFLVPSASLPTNPYRVRISERNFGEFRYDDLNAVLKALTGHLDVGRYAPKLN